MIHDGCNSKNYNKIIIGYVNWFYIDENLNNKMWFFLYFSLLIVKIVVSKVEVVGKIVLLVFF